MPRTSPKGTWARTATRPSGKSALDHRMRHRSRESAERVIVRRSQKRAMRLSAPSTRQAAQAEAIEYNCDRTLPSYAHTCLEISHGAVEVRLLWRRRQDRMLEIENAVGGIAQDTSKGPQPVQRRPWLPRRMGLAAGASLTSRATRRPEWMAPSIQPG
jgi:hypothetical protein